MDATAQPQPAKRFGRALLMGSLVLALGFTTTVAAATHQYRTTFLPNTIVGDIDISGMTLEHAKAVVATQVVGSDTVTVQLAQQQLTIPKTTIGVATDLDQVLRQAYTAGHSGRLLTKVSDIAHSLFTTSRHPVATTVDSAKIMAWVDGTLKPLVKDPVDATIGVQNSAVVISPSQDGLAIDLEKVADDIVTSASTGQSPRVTVAMNVVKPHVTADSLTTYQTQLEKLAHVPVQLTINAQVVTPTFAQQITWFTVPAVAAGGNESTAITLNTAAVARSVNEIAKKTNQKMVKEQVNPDGAVLIAGKDGLTMDEQNTVSQIVGQFNPIVAKSTELAGAAVTVAVATTVVPKEQTVVTTPQLAVAAADSSVVPAIDTDAKFLQISLAKQRMYVFENHQLINTFVVSTGKIGYETPKGVHQIYAKAPRPLSHRYGLYLPYWNAITADGGYGIHDLPEWPGGKKETAAHLGTPISHGCIRLGTEQAKYIYEWAPVGTAVVVQ